MTECGRPQDRALFHCPACNERRVVRDTRAGRTPPTTNTVTIWRRAHCPACGQRWTTYEIAAADFWQFVSQARQLAALQDVLATKDSTRS